MRNELKSPNFFKSPSKHLNSILVNPKIREKSNQPRYVSHKRTNDPIFSKSQSYSGETSDLIFSDEFAIAFAKLKKQNIVILSPGFNVCNGCQGRITCETCETCEIIFSIISYC